MCVCVCVCVLCVCMYGKMCVYVYIYIYMSSIKFIATKSVGLKIRRLHPLQSGMHLLKRQSR